MHANTTTSIDQKGATFSLGGVGDGVRLSMPFVAGVLAYGFAFGVVTHQAGLSGAEVALMCALVFAGSSQFVALSLWATPIPIGAIVLTTLVVNLRYFLMSAALRPWYLKVPPVQAYVSLFFLTDEGWALAMSRFARGHSEAAVAFGTGLALYVAWISASVAGHTLGNLVGNPARLGLDFVFAAVVLALLRGFWMGQRSLLSWLASGSVAVLAHQWLPGTWYIVLGGLAGALVGIVRDADQN
jgi:4-azaleucine resistance transporter AzlC